MRRTFLAIIFLTGAASGVRSQEVTVTTAFDTSRIYIGDQIKYTLSVVKPVSYFLSYPVFTDTLYKNIEILSGPVIDSSFLKDGRLKIRHQYLVTSFDSGFYQVPPVYAELRSESGIKRFYSDYAPLEVMRVRITPKDTASRFFDIIKPYRAPLTPGEILPWVLMTFIAAVVIWYIIRIIKRHRSRKSGEPVLVAREPAHVIAFRELERLRNEKLWQNGEVKMYYTRLSEILRQYLEDRFMVYSLELTTFETLRELVRSGFREDENYNILRNILTGSDLVKFARHKPDPRENDLHLENAWRFVEATKVILAEPETGNEEHTEKEV